MNKFCVPHCEDDMKKDVSEINSNDLDTVTQIANRQEFDVRFSEAIAKSKTTVCYLSILMIGIDYFNRLYDTYGQQYGDDCLRQITISLKSILKRSGDLAARWDVEKFACILSDTDSIGATEMAEKIRKDIIDLAIPNSASPVSDVVTVSIGVVTSILTDDTSYDQLLKKADQALSTARVTDQN